MNKKIKLPHTDELRCGKDLETASESGSVGSFRLPADVLKNIYAMAPPVSLPRLLSTSCPASEFDASSESSGCNHAVIAVQTDGQL